MKLQILIFVLSLSVLSCFECATENAVKIAKVASVLCIKAFDANNNLLAKSESSIIDGLASISMLLKREYMQGDSDYYPHANSNTEFGGRSFYSAKNAIDGIKQNAKHGIYPYHSNLLTYFYAKHLECPKY